MSSGSAPAGSVDVEVQVDRPIAEAFHVTRTLRAMELLALSPRSAPQLADGLGIHVRTARRLLRRLQGDGYVELFDERRRRYRPTMRVVALAGQVVQRAELANEAAPLVAELRNELGEDCHLCVPSYLSALCLVHAPRDSTSPCRPHLRELVPCHCTAAGKALLAWRERWRDAVLAERLESFTDRTTTGPEPMRRELGRIVARGYSIEDREFDPNTRAMGAPVVSARGETVAALAVAAPMDRLPAERYGDLGQTLVRHADAISAELRSEA